jgi:hypothetical protein
MRKSFVFIIVLVVAFIITAPKLFLFNHLQQFFSKADMHLSAEEPIQNIIGISFKNMELTQHKKILFSGKNISLELLGLYNTFKSDNTNVQTFLIEGAYLQSSYALWQPLHININLLGEFGQIKGSYQLRNKTWLLFLIPSEKEQKNPTLMQFFIKTEEGYKYELSF